MSGDIAPIRNGASTHQYRDVVARVARIDPAVLRRRYEDGASTVDLARDYAISRPTVRGILRKAGARLRTISEARKVRDQNAWLRLEKPEPVQRGRTISDVEGVVFEVMYATPTNHGFEILRGHPVCTGGKSSIILTRELAAHLESHRLDPGRLDLPISDRGVLVLRRRLAFNTRDEKRAWWEARRFQLADSDLATLETMAAERGIHPSTAAFIRRRLCGIRRPSQASWLDDEAKALLLSDRPRKELAAIFGLTPIYISYLRKKLRDLSASFEEPRKTAAEQRTRRQQT